MATTTTPPADAAPATESASAKKAKAAPAYKKYSEKEKDKMIRMFAGNRLAYCSNCFKPLQLGEDGKPNCCDKPTIVYPKK